MKQINLKEGEATNITAIKENGFVLSVKKFANENGKIVELDLLTGKTKDHNLVPYLENGKER